MVTSVYKFMEKSCTYGHEITPDPREGLLYCNFVINPDISCQTVSENKVYRQVMSVSKTPFTDVEGYQIMYSIYHILRPRRNGYHFKDDVLICIFLNWKFD